MQKLFVAGYIVLLCAFSSFAKLAPVSLENLVRNSDVVLVGTLTRISEREKDAVVSGTGEIVVDEVLAGAVETSSGSALEPGDRLKLNYAETFACVYGSHRRIENERVVWFLKIGDGGEITGENFVSLAALSEIKILARKLFVPAAGKRVTTENEPARNAAAVPRAAAGEEIGFCHYGARPRFYPFPAFLVVIGSISLYHLLYRSRFRIR